MDKILFGAAYYPEYMPYDRIDQDMEMMKQAGMNVIRVAESTWSTLEPEPGVFDFTYIDKILEAAGRFDMKVIVGTPTYAIPAWLAAKYPDILAETAEGKARYGHRQNMDITNQHFRGHVERVIRKLVLHVRNHPQVIGYQIDNETKHYGTAGPNVQAAFRQYLMEKFGTTKKLNETFHLAYWSNSIHRWEDLPDMKGCINGGLAAEFEKFQRLLAAEFLRWQADIVIDYKKKAQFITQNLDFEWRKFGADIAQDGYSYGVQPQINHYDAARFINLTGVDIYHPTQDQLTGAEIAYGGDSVRTLKQEPYLVLETQAQAFKYWTPYPGQLRLQAYSHLASGANGVMYWNWHSIHNSYETFWKGVLSHDLQPNRCYREAAVIGKEWNQIGMNHLCIRKKNKVAILVDNQTLTGFKWFPIDRDLSYNDVVRWVYDSLYEMNIECDIVDVKAVVAAGIIGAEGGFVGKNDSAAGAKTGTSGTVTYSSANAAYPAGDMLFSNEERDLFGQIKVVDFSSREEGFGNEKIDLNDYDLVVVPALYSASELLISALRDFVEKGGVLFATFKSFFANEFLTVYHDMQPHGMTDVFGMTYDQFVEPGYAAVDGRPVRYFAELLRTEAAYPYRRYQHQYWGDYAAMTVNHFGKGMAYYMGCYTEKDVLKHLLKKAAKDAKVLPEAGWEWPVVLRSGVNANGNKVRYVMNYSSKPVSLSCPWSGVADILTNKRYEPGDQIQLTDWGVAVLEQYTLDLIST